MESTLPSLEEMREANTMKIVSIGTKFLSKSVVKTGLHRCDAAGCVYPVVGDLYVIDDQRVQGFMPSKVLWCDDEYRVIYYVCHSLPQNVRPFEGNTYMLVFDVAVNDVIEYGMTMRLFIDQIVVDDRVKYIVMFGDETYNEITLTPKKGVIDEQ